MNISPKLDNVDLFVFVYYECLQHCEICLS